MSCPGEWQWTGLPLGCGQRTPGCQGSWGLVGCFQVCPTCFQVWLRAQRRRKLILWRSVAEARGAVPGSAPPWATGLSRARHSDDALWGVRGLGHSKTPSEGLGAFFPLQAHLLGHMTPNGPDRS